MFRMKISSHDATPSRVQMREHVANALGVKKDQVIVKNILQKYGSSELTILANVYDTPEKVPIFERSYMIVRQSPREKGEKKDSASPPSGSPPASTEPKTASKGAEKQ